jgi:hypothetical protein
MGKIIRKSIVVTLPSSSAAIQRFSLIAAAKLCYLLNSTQKRAGYDLAPAGRMFSRSESERS